jgi:uncharacterized protein YdaU (DUF1376 family)
MEPVRKGSTVERFYLADTRKLSRDQHGGYLLLLFEDYLHGPSSSLESRSALR